MYTYKIYIIIIELTLLKTSSFSLKLSVALKSSTNSLCGSSFVTSFTLSTTSRRRNRSKSDLELPRPVRPHSTGRGQGTGRKVGGHAGRVRGNHQYLYTYNKAIMYFARAIKHKAVYYNVDPLPIPYDKGCSVS